MEKNSLSHPFTCHFDKPCPIQRKGKSSFDRSGWWGWGWPKSRDFRAHLIIFICDLRALWMRREFSQCSSKSKYSYSSMVSTKTRKTRTSTTNSSQNHPTSRLTPSTTTTNPLQSLPPIAKMPTQAISKPPIYQPKPAQIPRTHNVDVSAAKRAVRKTTASASNWASPAPVTASVSAAATRNNCFSSAPARTAPSAGARKATAWRITASVTVQASGVGLPANVWSARIWRSRGSRRTCIIVATKLIICFPLIFELSLIDLVVYNRSRYNWGSSYIRAWRDRLLLDLAD